MFRKLPLHVKIVISMLVGIVVGMAVNLYWTSATWQSLGVGNAAAWLAGKTDAANAGASTGAGLVRAGLQLCTFTGQLFIRCLRFIAVPVVLFSLTAAVANLGDPRKLGRIGGKTIAIFLFTGFTSSTLGVVLTTLVRPGAFAGEVARSALPGQDVASANAAEQQASALSVWNMIMGAIPTNPFQAIAEANMLQVVVLSIALGLGLTLIPVEKSRPVIAFCEGIAEAVLRLVQLLMHAAPVAVFALVSVLLAGLGFGVFKALAVYCVVVVAGLAIILFVLYPGLTTLLTPRSNKVGFARYFRALGPAQMVAFTSSSSAATLPVTMECCRDRLGASEDVSSFVCSLGVSFNMDGTALYQAVVVTFLAQLYGIPLSFTDNLSVAMLAALLSIGVPGIPGGSLVVMAIVLDHIKVPTEGIAIILAVDRVLDMCRTVINVSGDAMGTAIVAASEGKLLTEAEVEARLAAGE